MQDINILFYGLGIYKHCHFQTSEIVVINILLQHFFSRHSMQISMQYKVSSKFLTTILFFIDLKCLNSSCTKLCSKRKVITTGD